MTWYHCTSEENAEAISEEGFRSMPRTIEGFEQMYLIAIDMFTRADLQKVYDAPDDDQKLAVAWKIVQRKFSKGTYIFLLNYPDPRYGDACYRVRLPAGSQVVEAISASGWVGWSPVRLRRKNLKRLTEEEVEALYIETPDS